MELETIKSRPLDEDELLLKNAFLTGESTFWDTPMTFAEYTNHLEAGRVAVTPSAHYYRDKTTDRAGVTVRRVGAPTHAEVTLHRRYSYPVLHNHDYLEIVYVAAGRCTNHFEDSSFEMTSGDICILAPATLHALSCTNDESCIVNLMVNRDFFNRTFLRVLRGGRVLVSFLENILYHHPTSPYILFPTGDDPWLQELARHLISEANQRPHAYETSIQLLVSEFLLHVAREYEMVAIVPNKRTGAPNNLIVAVLGYLGVNYHHATLAETAALFGYSPSYLSRLIKNSTGKTFSAIITDFQMERTVTLLKTGERNLSAIAQEVGCFDSSHLSKKFKRIYGMTPSRYINRFLTPGKQVATAS